MVDIMFLSAHPDDAEFAMGGTFLKLSRKYKCVHILLTLGEAGTHGTPKERKQEAMDAANFAGCEVEFLDFKDNHIEDTVENAKKIAEIIRKYKPKIIFSPYHTSKSEHHDPISHPDHIALGNIVIKAARFAKFKNAQILGETHLVSRVVYYMLPNYKEPTLVIDVSDVINDLQQLWDIHKSQHFIKDGKILNLLLSQRRIAGMNCGMELAEGFIVDGPIKIRADTILEILE